MKRILAYSCLLGLELQSFLQEQVTTRTDLNAWGLDFLNRLQAFTAVGKRLRGSLTCFAYEMFSGQTPTSQVLKTALALELTHSALLIHDDIMDNDPLRRGQPSVHRQYQQVGSEQKLSEATQFGASMAICVGDAALFLAFKLLGEAQAETAGHQPLSTAFVEQLIAVCAGQMQDVYFDARTALPSKTAVYELMAAKTASYSLALPLVMGATLAAQPPETIRHLQLLGTKAGLIFQIRDDELGLIGKTATLGKPVGSDIRQGKKTLLYYYLWRQCQAADRRQLQTLFGNPALTESDIVTVQRLFRHYRIDRLLARDIEQLQKQASHLIQKLPVRETDKQELESLVEFCATRYA